MEHSFGNLLVECSTKKSRIVWLRIGAIAALLVLGAAGYYFINFPFDPEDRIMGFVSLGLAVFLFLVLWFISNKIKQSVAIYETGVVVKKGRKEHPYHYNQISGLRDAQADDGFFVFGGAFGLVGAAVAGAASAVASNAIGASRRRNRIRKLSIVPNTLDLNEIGVVNTGGDVLSEVYTEWLKREKAITKESIPSLALSFGDVLELNQGMFTHKHRRGDVHLPLSEVTELDIRSDCLMFFGLNEKGKTKSLIDITITQVLNIDLLFDVYNMAKAQSE